MSMTRDEAITRAFIAAKQADIGDTNEFFEASLRESGFEVVPAKAIDLAVSRGCSHCADSIREARAILAAQETDNG